MKETAFDGFEKRIAGVMVPLFALRGANDLGCGDTGALREIITWAADMGFRLVQLLPVNETCADNSPYNAISSVAIEPTTIDLSVVEDLGPDEIRAVTESHHSEELRRGEGTQPKATAEWNGYEESVAHAPERRSLRDGDVLAQQSVLEINAPTKRAPDRAGSDDGGCGRFVIDRIDVHQAEDHLPSIVGGPHLNRPEFLGDLISWEDGVDGTSKSVFAGGA